MQRVFIVYAPAVPEMAEISASLEKAFERNQYSVVVKTAEEAIMPDIAGADIVLFGDSSGKKGLIDPDYKEIKRSLQGINLAGRKAGVFSFNSHEILKNFAQILKDSEISLLDEVFVPSIPVSSGNVKSWISKILAL